jgi:hypothetical protein
MVDVESWIKRADEILASSHSTHNASEQMQFATSTIAAFYGPESPQMKNRLQLHARELPSRMLKANSEPDW